ncbi:MAG TPA: myxococcus cysteine-rich repeat containing protein [Candidatus Binatia bacterium]|nr:myxococcus cysteine-rich repeat containing protein [Candidatus Binatia bacterium]
MRGPRIPPLVSPRTPFLRATLVVALVASARVTAAQPLAARDLARLRKVTVWDLSVHHHVSESGSGSGAHWTYSEAYDHLSDESFTVSGVPGCDWRAGPFTPCTMDFRYPATGHAAESFDIRDDATGCNVRCDDGICGCEQCIASGCPDAGGHACQSLDEQHATGSGDVVGVAGDLVSAGALVLDYDVNPPVVVNGGGSVGRIAVPWARTLQYCDGTPITIQGDRGPGADGRFADTMFLGSGDAHVIIEDGRFVIRGQAHESYTSVNTSHPDPVTITHTEDVVFVVTEHGADTEVVGIEVTQAVQSWQNTVPLLAGKPTVVRAHVQPLGTKPVKVSAQLRAYRDGAELPGSPMAAVNPDSSVLARPNAAGEARRSDFTATLDWLLPPEWTTGTVDLVVDSQQLVCHEAAEPGGVAHDCTIHAAFAAPPAVHTKLVAVAWAQGGSTYGPSDGDLDELEDRLRAIYPVAAVDATHGSLAWTGAVPPDLGALNARLDLMRFLEDCFPIGSACNRAYYGALAAPKGFGGFPVGPTSTASGLANGVPGSVASGYAGDSATAYQRNCHAHELAHVLGRPHAVDPAIFGTDAAGDPLGPCGAVAGVGAETFPFMFAVGGTAVATIGPLLSGDDQIMYGLDAALGVVDPYQTFELMSYCQGTSPAFGQSKWISSHTYVKLRDALAASPWGGPPGPASSGTAADLLIVRGTVAADSAAAAFLPFVHLEGAPRSPTAGDWTLERRDAGGRLLGTTAFAPSFGEIDVVPGAPAADVHGPGEFVVAVPADAGLAEVDLVHGGTRMAAAHASAHAPTVAVVFPNGGEILTGARTTLAWSASDADGDPLAFLVQYSRDGGTTWDTLAADWPATTLDIPLDRLPGTTTGLVRVVASDGFLSAAAVSAATFTVEDKAPAVRILPPTGAPVAGTQTVVLRGEGRDPEDGPLPDGALVWAADGDAIGTGAVVMLPSSGFSEGPHTLTLTGTDRAGHTAQASVPLSVTRKAPVCGDGVVDPGEQCDDGNPVSGDGCEPDCTSSPATTTSTTSTTSTSSTSTTASPTTTTTSPPAAQRCASGPSLAGLDCRLGLLVEAVRGAGDLGALAGRLIGNLESARQAVEQAARTTAKRRKAAKNLHRALEHLRAFEHVLNGRRARKTLAASLRSTLGEQAHAIRTDLQAIRF